MNEAKNGETFVWTRQLHLKSGRNKFTNLVSAKIIVNPSLERSWPMKTTPVLLQIKVVKASHFISVLFCTVKSKQK